MSEVQSIEGLLYSLNRGNDNPKLKVIKNKKGSVIWKETTGTVTVKLPDNHTYTVSRATFDKIEPYLY